MRKENIRWQQNEGCDIMMLSRVCTYSCCVLSLFLFSMSRYHIVFIKRRCTFYYCCCCWCWSSNKWWWWWCFCYWYNYTLTLCCWKCWRWRWWWGWWKNRCRGWRWHGWRNGELEKQHTNSWVDDKDNAAMLIQQESITKLNACTWQAPILFISCICRKKQKTMHIISTCSAHIIRIISKLQKWSNLYRTPLIRITFSLILRVRSIEKISSLSLHHSVVLLCCLWYAHIVWKMQEICAIF